MLATITNLIKERRSIFPANYTGEIIDDRLIEMILENATWAPTHGLTEPWHFVVFKGKGLQKLGEFQANLYKELGKEEFDQKKYEKLLQNPQLCSHVIAIGVKTGANPKIPLTEEIEAVACAVQNMHLTATAMEIGAYWGSGGVTYYEEAKAFFGLEEKDVLLGFFFLGVPKDKNFTTPKRTPFALKTTWVSE